MWGWIADSNSDERDRQGVKKQKAHMPRHYHGDIGREGVGGKKTRCAMTEGNVLRKRTKEGQEPAKQQEEIHCVNCSLEPKKICLRVRPLVWRGGD